MAWGEEGLHAVHAAGCGEGEHSVWERDACGASVRSSHCTPLTRHADGPLEFPCLDSCPPVALAVAMAVPIRGRQQIQGSGEETSPVTRGTHLLHHSCGDARKGGDGM